MVMDFTPQLEVEHYFGTSVILIHILLDDASTITSFEVIVQLNNALPTALNKTECNDKHLI